MKRSALLACLAFCTAASLSAAAAKEGATAHVTIANGPNAGKHSASSNEGGCSMGLTGKNSFGVQLSNPKDKDPKKLNSVQVIVMDMAKPAGFMITVGFGPLMGRTASYTIDTTKKQGTGTMAISQSGSTAQLKFSGTAPDGTKLEGTVDCNGVFKAG